MVEMENSMAFEDLKQLKKGNDKNGGRNNQMIISEDSHESNLTGKFEDYNGQPDVS